TRVDGDAIELDLPSAVAPKQSRLAVTVITHVIALIGVSVRHGIACNAEPAGNEEAPAHRPVKIQIGGRVQAVLVGTGDIDARQAEGEDVTVHPVNARLVNVGME